MHDAWIEISLPFLSAIANQKVFLSLWNSILKFEIDPCTCFLKPSNIEFIYYTEFMFSLMNERDNLR